MITSADMRKTKKGHKCIDHEKSKYFRGKFQQAVQTLKKKGVSSDTSEEEKEKEEDESDSELELPEVMGISLNLSHKKLKNFPEELLDKMSQIQYLYLEGNKLAELPEKFFEYLFSLKWLDLRNNNLTALPTAGLKNHNSLEVILLQGNRIRNLPTELATIPSLKGLQTTGNPITNVPYEVISGGFQQIMKHLEKLRSQDEILFPLSDPIVVKPSTSRDNSTGIFSAEENEITNAELKMWDLDKLSQWRHFIKKKSKNLSEFNFRHYVATNVNDIITQQPKISVSLSSQPKLVARPQPFRCGVYSRNRHRITSAIRYLKTRKTRLGYVRKPITVEMIQEKARNEAYKAQMRETLEKQAKKIQRMRDKDMLKNWRDHARLTRQQIKLLDNYQQYPSKDFAHKTPFDIDPEFLNMLNRVDLYRNLKEYDNRSKSKKKPKVKITALDLERQMNEIIKKLQELDTNDKAAEEISSPGAKHNHMSDKIHKIMDIQKTLKNLQMLNSSVYGIMPIIRKKNQRLDSQMP